MFPQNLLPILFCVFYCYAQAKENIIMQDEMKTTMTDSMIISTAMACSMFLVLIVLVPTILYYRFKREIET